MTDEVPRKRNGQFQKGAIANPHGRPRQRRIDPKLPAARREVVMRVADRVVEIKINGKVEQLSLYEACVLQLARGGAQGNRVSAQKFIDLAMETSMDDLANRNSAKAWVDRMIVLEEENEDLRKKTSQRHQGPVVLGWEGYQRHLEEGEKARQKASPDDEAG